MTIEDKKNEWLKGNLNRLRTTLFCRANPQNHPVDVEGNMYIEFNDAKQEICFHRPVASVITWTFKQPLHYELTKHRLIDRFYTVI